MGRFWIAFLVFFVFLSFELEAQDIKEIKRYLIKVKNHLRKSYIFKEQVTTKQLNKAGAEAIRKAIEGKAFPDLTQTERELIKEAINERSITKTITAIWKLTEDEDVEIDLMKLADIAARGMVKSIGDPYSAILDKKAFEKLMQIIKGKKKDELIGIGLREKDGKFVIIQVMYGYSAYYEGLEAGDYLLEVNGKSVKGKKLMEVIQMIKVNPKKPVKLKIYRPSHKKEYVFTLRHRRLPSQTVFYKMFGRSIGYVRLSEFALSSTKELRKTLKKLKAQRMEGLILDLRFNPGGALQTATSIADIFLKQGLVITKTKSNYQVFGLRVGSMTFRTKRKSDFEEIPMVVLINKHSASASELLSGALQDHKRATLIGETTHGKGVGQNVIPLIDGELFILKPPKRSLFLTVLKYDLPSGRSINKKGVKPDIFVEIKRPTAREFAEILRIRYSKVLQDYLDLQFNKNRELLLKLINFDNFDPSQYPEFDKLYKNLNTSLNKERVRIILRKQIIKRLVFRYGREIPCDLGSDPQLQRALYILLEKLE